MLFVLWRGRSGEIKRPAVHSAQPVSAYQKLDSEQHLFEYGRGSSRGQPPASNEIECPGSLAVQDFRHAERELLRRRAVQK